MKVACIGECMVELTLPREKGGETRVGFAGDTFNVAVYLARSAPEIAVSYVTAVGTDQLSEGMVAAFAGEGLDTSLVERRADRAPGLYAISVDAKGERSFTYWRENSAARTLFVPPAEVTPARLAGYDLVYLSGITVAVLRPEGRQALLDFLPGYRAAGGRVAFDSNYRPRLWPGRDEARAALAAFWRLTDVALPSIDDEIALWGGEAGDVIDRLRGFGVHAGALKRGAEGPVPIGPCGPLPPFPAAARVVDTTAAGDSFNGAYLAAMLRGEEEAACLAAGHAMAAEVIGHPGAIIPRRGAVRAG